MMHPTTRFAQGCAHRLEQRFGHEAAVERLQERIDNGPVEDRPLYADILDALRARRRAGGAH